MLTLTTFTLVECHGDDVDIPGISFSRVAVVTTFTINNLVKYYFYASQTVKTGITVCLEALIVGVVVVRKYSMS